MSTASLSDPVQYIKGIGPRRAGLLRKIGITTVEDALYYLPFRYEDRRSLSAINRLTPGRLWTVRGTVASVESIRTPRKHFPIFELVITDGSGILRAKWFNQPFLRRVFRKGQEVILSGVVKVNAYHGVGFEMENPEYEIMDGSGSDSLIHTSRVVPVYSTTSGLGQKTLRSMLYSIVMAGPAVQDYMPAHILERLGLVPLEEALKNVHFPGGDMIDVAALNGGTSPYHRRLAFDELFIYQIGVITIRQRMTGQKGISFSAEPALTEGLLESLPFTLTPAQQRVVAEIFRDMESGRPMNRLLQGDVGSGKTVVALLAMLKAVENGYQASLMVPTDLLAQQHFLNIRKLLGDMDVTCGLRTSRAVEGPQDADIVVGTHALIQERTAFRRLGLAVIDEQHRFGVRQRALLRKKGMNPDVLVMTATPIPRTLAMTLYGDLEHSVIDELPPGRTPVETLVVAESERQRVYDLITREVRGGGQAYVVYPLIEGDSSATLHSAERGCQAMKDLFPDLRIELVHGKMKAEDRSRVMDAFRRGETDILVSTTVIEVGVDVPGANVMIIVHAERFGLAQLHQLRGRVGRGRKKSFCVLLYYGSPGEDAMRRLRAMADTTDGFRIAEEDLKIRGPGDFFGTAQSGFPELKIADLVRDSALLRAARQEAAALLGDDPSLERHPLLRERVNRVWKDRVEFFRTV